jgi:glyoxylase-like metal-dependent hydrolase (beta-lactamase superfamily II)
MRSRTYGRYLTQLTRFPHAFPMNCYLVREDDGLTLIDTTMLGRADDILRAAAVLGAPIVRIALTHAHSDHVGHLDALHAALPEAAVLVPAREARFLAGDRTLDPAEQHDSLKGSWKTCTTRPTRSLAPGDRVGSLEVVASPGHTPGHQSFFDPREGTLIAGDAFQTQAGIAVSGVMRPLFPFPAMATWDRSAAVESAIRLQALNPARLAVGHGPVIEEPRQAVDHAIKEAIARRDAAKGRTRA